MNKQIVSTTVLSGFPTVLLVTYRIKFWWFYITTSECIKMPPDYTDKDVADAVNEITGQWEQASGAQL